jgi:hypothetical protein
MAITVATVPHMSRTLGGNNAEEIVNERFDFAQEYANGAFDDAQNYLLALQSIFNRLNLPLPDVTIDEQSLSLENPSIGAEPTPPSDAQLTPASVEAPDVPDLADVTLMDLPVISAQLPDVPGSEADFSYSQTAYASELANRLAAMLRSYVDLGGTGLGAAVEDAIWTRALQRQEGENERAYREAENFFAARGFDMPPGALVGQVTEINREILRNRTGINAEITIEQARLAKQFTVEILTAGINYENVERQHFNQTANRALEAAKAAVDAVITVYAEKVKSYVATMEGYKAQADAFKAQADAQNSVNDARVDRYKAMVEAYKARVTTELSIVENLAKIYGYRINGYEARARVAAIELDAQIKEYEGRLKQEELKTSIELKEADMVLQAYLAAMNMEIEGTKAGANIAAQIAASALSAIHASATIGDSSSRSDSNSFSHAESLANSASITESHSITE